MSTNRTRNGNVWLLLAVLLPAAILPSCGTGRSTQPSETADSIKQALNTLPRVSLDFDNLYSTLRNIKTERLIERNKGDFLYNLRAKDSIAFDQADYLVPIGKFFETPTVLSIVFRDFYDYKEAIHIFNFAKPSLMPVSSFIPFSYGGDAEDFWHTDVKALDSLTFEITETTGRYSNIATRDTTFISLRKVSTVQIDPIDGKIQRKHLKTETNLIQVQ